jgi:hypothetical protein
MKKLIFLILFLIVSYTSFSHEDITFMTEINTGYAVGINLDNSVFLDARLSYLYKMVGFTVEFGSLFTPDKFSFHTFLGPMISIVNNEKWRVPLTIGFDLFYGKTLYYGIGSSFSLHYKLTKNFYVGINLGITYAFNNVYDEITGYKTNKEVDDDGTGNAIFVERTVPIIESINHYGSYIYIKPSILIGFQF